MIGFLIGMEAVQKRFEQYYKDRLNKFVLSEEDIDRLNKCMLERPDLLLHRGLRIAYVTECSQISFVGHLNMIFCSQVKEHAVNNYITKILGFELAVECSDLITTFIVKVPEFTRQYFMKAPDGREYDSAESEFLLKHDLISRRKLYLSKDNASRICEELTDSLNYLMKETEDLKDFIYTPYGIKILPLEDLSREKMRDEFDFTHVRGDNDEYSFALRYIKQLNRLFDEILGFSFSYSDIRKEGRLYIPETFLKNLAKCAKGEKHTLKGHEPKFTLRYLK